MIHAYRGVLPKGHASSWIADSADLIEADLELIYRSAKGYMSLAAESRIARGA